jgi:hypothetical protein
VPGVVGYCINVEASLGRPTVAPVLAEFRKQEKERSMTSGMPTLRIEYIQDPVWGKTPEQLRKTIIEGKSPVTGRPVMQEIVEVLNKALTDEEKKTGGSNNNYHSIGGMRYVQSVQIDKWR